MVTRKKYNHITAAKISEQTKYFAYFFIFLKRNFLLCKSLNVIDCILYIFSILVFFSAFFPFSPPKKKRFHRFSPIININIKVNIPKKSQLFLR